MEKLKKILTYRKDIYFIIILILLLIIIYMFFTNNKKYDQKLLMKNPYDIKVTEYDNFVFLGDSITDWYPLDEFYDDIPVVNSGIAGNKTTDILKDIEKRVGIYNPTKVFLLIGTNDVGERSPKEIVNNIGKIVNKIKKIRPKTKIYIESLLPVNNTDDSKVNKETVRERTNKEIEEINKLLKEYCNKNKITYINTYDEFIGKEKQLELKYTTDGLHLSNLGYLHLTKILLPYLNE